MKTFVEWQKEEGKTVRLEYQGKDENIERTALDISRVWKSPVTNIIKVDKGAKRISLSIIRN